MIADYQEYMQLNNSNRDPQPQGGFHLIYSPIVELAIGYLSSEGLNFACELLFHAKNNNVKNSYYTPEHASMIEESDVYVTLVNNGLSTGTGEFPNSTDHDSKDLFLAIHGFTYYKSSSGRAFVLTDCYDYAKGDMSGVVGVATELMYQAQEAGVIVPFLIELNFDTDRSRSDPAAKYVTLASNSRFYQQIVTLGSLEWQNFYITFNRSGRNIIQTFSVQDTILVLLDQNGDIIETDNDDGYSINFWIQFYATAGVEYRIIVMYKSSSYYGRSRTL